MAIYPTKTNKLNNKNRRLKLGLTLTIVFSLLLIFVAFNLIDIFTISVLGVIGLFFYPLCVAFITNGIMLMCGKKIKATKSIVILSILSLIFFVLIMQLATSKTIDGDFVTYISTTFKSGTTAGGVVFATLLYPLYTLTYDVATYVILIICLVISVSFLTDRIYIEIKNSKTDAERIQDEKHNSIMEAEETEEDGDIVEEETASTTEENEDEIFISDEEEQKQMARSILGLSKNENTESSEEDNQESYDSEDVDDEEDSYEDIRQSNATIESLMTSKSNEYRDQPHVIEKTENEVTNVAPVKKEPKVDENKVKLDAERRQAALDYLNISNGKFETNNKKKGIDNVAPPKSEMWDEDTDSSLKEQTVENENRLSASQSAKETLFGNNEPKIDEDLFKPNNYQSTNPDRSETLQNLDTPTNLYDNNLTKSNFNEYRENYNTSRSFNNSITDIPKKAQEIYSGEVKENIVDNQSFRPVQVSMMEPAKPKPTQKVYKKPPTYNRPPLDLLGYYSSDISGDEEYIRTKGKLIEDTLAAFKIETKVINAIKGPTFTRYELQMTPGISVNSVNGKINDLSMALESTCRILIPIPGKNAFGIEVPNKKRVTVGLREILESDNFKNNKSPLAYALGKDISGECKVSSIDKMPHLLVAGGTNSGKSVCLASLLVSILYKSSPDEVKLILVDPKRVEFTPFNGLPHLLVPNAITDCEKAVMALSWLVEEMDNRYNRLMNLGVKNIKEYNESNEVLTGQVEKMYYIVMVFDEVGDFMVRAKKEIEEKVILISQKARAAGIHLILATQSPKVEVITGTIKANMPSRIAFTVTNYQESKTILDSSGAEYLLGMGDMLFSPQGSRDPDRIQGCYVATNELKAIIQYIKDHNEAVFDESIEQKMFTKDEGFDASTGAAEEQFDALMKDCLRYFLKSKRVSTSSLQGYFGIGYPRASKIIMQMEKSGFVSPADSNGRRTLYMSEQEFEERFGEDLNE